MVEATYILKNKVAFHKANEVFKDFNEVFQRACNIQMSNEDTFIGFCVRLSDIDFTCKLYIEKEDIELKEELKPYVWYDRSEFDGNPNNYILVEEEYNGQLTITEDSNTELWSETGRFMYLEY